MANITSHKSTVFFNSVSILFFVLMVATAESLIIGRDPLLLCQTVVMVASGDTCFAIAQEVNLNIDIFYSFNPNLNCDALFVGQWLCTGGKWI
ncbi:hypothetical protein BT93_I0170 [Corymbia citriodora subsp. variegata]|nr:hypothetical protein BT93_I0170 [Corymbia citriodora subsp. variegata]